MSKPADASMANATHEQKMEYYARETAKATIRSGNLLSWVVWFQLVLILLTLVVFTRR